jgi:hypothetical protein
MSDLRREMNSTYFRRRFETIDHLDDIFVFHFTKNVDFASEEIQILLCFT